MGYAEKLYEITRNKNKCPLNKLIMEEIMKCGNSKGLGFADCVMLIYVNF